MERKGIRSPTDILERKNILDRRLLCINNRKRQPRSSKELYRKSGVAPCALSSTRLKTSWFSEREFYKEGKTVFELSATCEGDKCIPPGEPCDLVAAPFIPIYRELGRDNFLRMLKEEDELTVNKAKECVKKYKAENKSRNDSK